MQLFPPVLILVCLLLNACTNSGAHPESTFPTPAPNASRPLPDVDAMVRRLITQDGCRDFNTQMRLTAQNRNGKRQQAVFSIERKYSKGSARSFLAVLSPEDEQDKAILAVEKSDAPTQAFSYLAGLKKLSQFSSDRQLGAHGTKVTVQELLGMELGQYTHDGGSRVSQENDSQIKVTFKQKPDRSLAFPRIVGYFHEADGIPARFDLYNDRDEWQKRVTIVEVQSIQNHRTITRARIEDLNQQLELELETLKIEYDRGLADSLFTVDRLKRHVSRVGQKLIQ